MTSPSFKFSFQFSSLVASINFTDHCKSSLSEFCACRASLQYLIGGCAWPIIYADGVVAEVMRICEFSPQRADLNIINFANTSRANNQSHHCVYLHELTVFSYYNHSVPSPGRAGGHVVLVYSLQSKPSLKISARAKIWTHR
jgi:hypothetical protein